MSNKKKSAEIVLNYVYKCRVRNGTYNTAINIGFFLVHRENKYLFYKVIMKQSSWFRLTELQMIPCPSLLDRLITCSHNNMTLVATFNNFLTSLTEMRYNNHDSQWFVGSRKRSIFIFQNPLKQPCIVKWPLFFYWDMLSIVNYCESLWLRGSHSGLAFCRPLLHITPSAPIRLSNRRNTGR